MAPRPSPSGAGPSRLLISLVLAAGLCAAVPVQAQFLPFGRNKIQYEGFDWHIYRTEHFDIYYYPEMMTLARRGAAFAEESFRRLEQDFDFTVPHRIPLIFYSTPVDFQQTNITPGFIPEGVGGFFEFLKGRVVIPCNGSLEQFRHVIAHELVHVFMHNKIERVLRDHGQPNDKYPPLWFVEGLAEFYSTTWDSQAEMLLRDAVLAGYFHPISRIGAITGSFLMYKEGQAALEFIAHEYGRHRIVELIDNIWVSQNFDEVMQYTLGVSVEEFDRAWMASLRRRYFPGAAVRALPSEASVELAGEGFNAKPLIWYDGDSSWIVHLANRTGYSEISITPLRGGPPRTLVTGEKTDAFEALRLFHGRGDISRSGMLAFVAKSGERDVLHVFDLRTEELRASFSFPSLVMIGTVSWDPAGERIVLSGLARSGESDLYVLSLADRRLEPLTADFYDDRDPAWSPDGTRIAFISDRGRSGAAGHTGLFTIEPDNGRISILDDSDAEQRSPAWSVDGRLLAYTSDRDGTHDLYVLRPSHGRADTVAHRVTSFAGSVADPVWTRNGSLVFTAFEAYSFRIRGIRDVASRIDSLPAVPVLNRSDGSSPWRPREWEGVAAVSSLRYEKEYQLDIAQSQISTDPVFGTLGGAALSMSDMLGDDRYYFLLYNTAQTTGELLSSFNIAISRISMGSRTPWAYGIFHYSGRRYDFLDPDRYFIERAYGGYFALAYPLSRFTRIEGVVSVTNSDKEALTEFRQRRALLVTNSVSYVTDNALYYYTGPIDGHRFNLTLASTMDVQYSNVNYFSVMADYRRYLRLGSRSALAFRAELLYNEGKEARRYFLGGSWDLRGWPRWSIRGTKRWLSSAELRFPLLDRVALDFPFGSIPLGILRGAVFVDAGNCWDSRYDATLGSIGTGVRLSLFGALVLRYDVGKRIEGNFTTLQPDLFHQFFFGWDF